MVEGGIIMIGAILIFFILGLCAFMGGDGTGLIGMIPLILILLMGFILATPN